MFCTFCLCTSHQIENLNLEEWQLQDSAEVRAQAEEWKRITTLTARTACEKETASPSHTLGIGRDAGATKQAKEIDLEERFTDADVADSEDELTELYNQALSYDDPMSGSYHSLAPTSPSPSLASLDTVASSD
ncbi:hypothetical protein DXG01_010077, partial [Tephrocybe rancida]